MNNNLYLINKYNNKIINIKNLKNFNFTNIINKNILDNYNKYKYKELKKIIIDNFHYNNNYNNMERLSFLLNNLNNNNKDKLYYLIYEIDTHDIINMLDNIKNLYKRLIFKYDKDNIKLLFNSLKINNLIKIEFQII